VACARKEGYVKRIVLLMLAASLALVGTSLADTWHAAPTVVKHKVHKHKAHKVVKHKVPKRSHNPV